MKNTLDGRSFHIRFPIGTASHLVHSLAMGAGLGDEDQAACVKPLEQAAGTKARRNPSV